MKRNRKSMLLSSLAMLMVSTIALSSATYAWFTSGNTAKVGNFDFTAQSAGGIQISANGDNWVSALNQANLSAVAGNYFPAATNWKPMSSGGLVTADGGGKSFNLYSADFTNDGKITSALASTTEGSTDTFIKFDLYVKNDGTAATNFCLNFTGTEDQSSWVKAGTGDGKVDSGIQNAARVAFINHGSVRNGSASDLSTLKTTTTVTGAWIWEPNATAHENSSYSDAVATFGIKAANSTGVLAVNNRFPDGASEVQEQNASSGFHQATEKTTILELGANSITKFTVYIWLEGQDVDCTNYESGGSLSVNLAFLGDPKQTN